MIVRDDQLDAIQAASDQAVEESAPMHLSLGQCGRKCGFQGMMFYALCRAFDSFVGMGKNTPTKSPADVACQGRAKPPDNEFTESMLH